MVVVKIKEEIRDENLQYNINKEVAKILAASSVKSCKYEYLKGEEILPSDRSQMVEKAKFTNSPIGKAFKKANEDQGEKQAKTLYSLEYFNKY